MQTDTLRELAIVFTERGINNPSIDWTIKENVRTKLHVIVKRALHKFGYPPELE
jgi:type I restriction enzyme, R subunit